MIGTSALVYPAAGLVQLAQAAGATPITLEQAKKASAERRADGMHSLATAGTVSTRPSLLPLVDEHGQLGTGAWSPFGGMHYRFEQGRWLAFAGLSGRVHSTNGHGYGYGSAVLWSVHGQYVPARRIVLDLGDVAVHFEHARASERAARYRRRAGEHALRQHAYREAADHATRGLDSLGVLADSGERTQQELALQVTLGSALTATQGYAAPEVARTYARAWELCAQLGDPPQLLPVLLGVGRFYVVRGEFQTARDVGAHLLTFAEAAQDPVMRLAAHNALGVASLYAGDLDAAITRYFATVGRRWDEEWLVTASAHSA